MSFWVQATRQIQDEDSYNLSEIDITNLKAMGLSQSFGDKGLRNILDCFDIPMSEEYQTPGSALRLVNKLEKKLYLLNDETKMYLIDYIKWLRGLNEIGLGFYYSC